MQTSNAKNSDEPNTFYLHGVIGIGLPVLDCADVRKGRITGLANPSVCLYVRPSRAHNSKTKRRRKLKIKIDVIVSLLL